MVDVVEVPVSDGTDPPVEIEYPVSGHTIILVTGNQNNAAKQGVKLLNELRIGDIVQVAYKQGEGSGACFITDLNDVIIGEVLSQGINVTSVKLADNWYGF